MYVIWTRYPRQGRQTCGVDRTRRPASLHRYSSSNKQTRVLLRFTTRPLSPGQSDRHMCIHITMKINHLYQSPWTSSYVSSKTPPQCHTPMPSYETRTAHYIYQNMSAVTVFCCSNCQLCTASFVK
jgi:hypothetical protein